MIATTYPNADEFLAKTQKILEHNESANNLMLGLSLRLRQFPALVKTPYFATVTNQDELVLAAMMTPPRALVIYSHHDDWPHALNPMIHELDTREWPLPGVLAPPDIAEEFAAAWAALKGTIRRILLRTRLYELRRVNPIPPVSGRLRLATPADLELVAGWSLAFQNEALTGGDPAETREVARHKINDQDLYLWEDGRQPVSMAGQSRPTTHGICLSLVYTPPEQRGKGYATACVAQLSQRLLDSGRKFCVLFTDLANPTSNHIYQTIGYTPVRDFTEYVFDSERHP
jgi:predicted GNAT family acetyltransferase